MNLFRHKIQNYIDRKAHSRNYDNGVSLASYINSTNAVWALEAERFIEWRDQVWIYVLDELDKVLNAQREIPEVEKFLSKLPEIDWPE